MKCLLELHFRQRDRSIRNQAYNPMSDAWSQGWIGAKEGAYGFLEVMGDATGGEMLTDIGEAGVSRARHQQDAYAEILTDWKDVRGISSGVEFLVNNAAMSLPYMITSAGAAVAGAVFIQSVSSFALTRLLSVEAQHLIALLRVQVQKQIIHLPISFFDNTKSGALVSRIMTDVEGVRNLVGTGLVQLFGGILTSIISLGILIRINPQMTLFAVLPLILFGLISLKAFAYIRPIFRKPG